MFRDVLTIQRRYRVVPPAMVRRPALQVLRVLIASVASTIGYRVNARTNKYKRFHRIISRILTALYSSHLSVFSHKTLGLGREPLMLLYYYKNNLKLPVYIKVSKGNKVGWQHASTDPSARRHTANAAHYWILDLSATCIGGATIMSRLCT